MNCEKHPITQIALRTIKSDTFELVNEFETFVKPYGDLEITQKALDYTNISMKDLVNAPSHKEVIKVLIEFFKQSKSSVKTKPILCGHHVDFDISFLEAFFAFNGKKLKDYVQHSNGKYYRHCTLRMAREAFMDDDFKNDLTTCCKRIGHEIIDAHGAMTDVIATEKLLVYFLNKLRSKGTSFSSNVNKEESMEKIRHSTVKPFQF